MTFRARHALSCFLACLLILCLKLEMIDQVIGTEVNRPVSVSFYDDLARNWVVLNICCIYNCLRRKIPLLALFLSPQLPLVSLQTSLKKNLEAL